jgi:ubiquinone/menaquinone biosynthesis C-methylase UbiE
MIVAAQVWGMIRAVANADPDAKRNFVRESFSEAARTYDVSPFFETPGRRIVELAGVKEGDRVLDVATGRGAVLWPALQHVGTTGHIDAIDLAPPMIELTLADVKARGVSNVTLQVMDAEQLAYADDTFDSVLCGLCSSSSRALAVRLAKCGAY